MRWVTNSILQIFFFVLFILITAFFADGGHGTYVPYAILFGPFSSLFFLASVFFISSTNGEHGDFLLLLIIFLFLLSLLQPVIYGVLRKKFSEKKDAVRSSVILFVIHLVGAIVGLLFCAVEDFHRVELSTVISSYLVSIAVIGVYWRIFFKLINLSAKKS